MKFRVESYKNILSAEFSKHFFHKWVQTNAGFLPGQSPYYVQKTDPHDLFHIKANGILSEPEVQPERTKFAYGRS